LRGVIATTREIRRLVRDIYLHPGCLGLLAMIWVFTTLFAPGDRVQVMSLPLRALYNAAGALFYCLTGYLLLPHLLRATLLRNIPFIWTNVVFYAVLAGIETLAFLALFPEARGAHALFYWLTTTALIVIAVALAARHFEPVLRRRLSRQPELLPMWRPLRLPTSNLETLLPAGARGPVRRMEAQNQYVHVITEAGEALLRMSLSEAESRLPKGLGLRIHRSIWMRKADMDTLVFRRGNPRLRDIENREFPVSRRKVAELRAILGQGDATARQIVNDNQPVS